MATWDELIAQVLVEVEDDSTFHNEADVKSYLAQAELLTVLSRVLYERTAGLTLDPKTAVYRLHTHFPDCIKPLRIVVDGRPLTETNLAALSLLYPNWSTEQGDPEWWCMIGGIFLAIVPLGAVRADITYLAAPTTIETSPRTNTHWHLVNTEYAKAIALAKESQYARAQEALNTFLDKIGSPRDPRLLEGAAQKTAQNTVAPIIKEAND